MTVLRLVLAAAALAAPALAAPQRPAAEPFALVGARLLDGTGAGLVDGVTIVVRDGRIASVERGGAPPAGLRAIDLAGRVVLPGLIDAHVHIGSLAQAEKALRSGITTVRSMGTAHFADVGLRELREKGAVEIPEVLAAGYHVTPRPAEALFLDEPSLAPLFSGVRGPEAFRRLVAAQIARGVDWIKTAATERAGLPDTDPRKQTMTEEELRAVVEEAARAGIPVAAHAHGDEGAAAAVRAGVRSIEHGTYLSTATLDLMKERGTYLVPTVAVVTDLMDPGGDYDDPVLRVRGRHMLPRLRRTVRGARERGIPIVAATDTSFRSSSTLTLQREIEELARSGLDPLEAIRAATATAAALLGIEARTGTVAPGKEADLIVVDENPLEDLRILEDVLLVVNDGRIVVDRLSFALEPGAR